MLRAFFDDACYKERLLKAVFKIITKIQYS